ncbi:MAG: hypothetical protein D6689_04475 [Deltaproteobacteria bacterium]|nr:MAG: hypothetical protein D6689_04475 [Deltaproteobacteria bacterium]
MPARVAASPIYSGYVAFGGTARYELVGKLGEGGMGRVYEAVDTLRGMRVAVKTLRDIDATSLYRFKREFRALADISHPNIVTHYELASDGDEWFFTMELVEGCDILHYVRPDDYDSARVRAAREAAHAADGATLATNVALGTTRADAVAGNMPVPVVPTARRPRVAFGDVADASRLRDAFVQLAGALDALHAAGMVHRDLKPSNVRVTPAGRVVLMDFGIVAELTHRAHDAAGGVAVGTPAYMAPEQAAGDPPSPAADWYAFGVVLFAALTGRLPFTGRKAAILAAKQMRDAPDPRRFVTGAPTEWTALCAALLARRPEDRPTARDVLLAFGARRDRARTAATTHGDTGLFVGRERELAELHASYQESRGGRPVAAALIGPAGIGKSTLLRRFTHEIAMRDERALALYGRCYERESLPFKAFDPVFDHLTQQLCAGRAAVSSLPADIGVATRLFPVLRRIPGVAGRPNGTDANPTELRARAFAAVRELFGVLAAAQPVLVCIDDLQWADDDSAELLDEVVRPPGAPGVLLVAAMRSEDVDRDGAIAGRMLDVLASRATLHRIDVGPLDARERRELCERLLGPDAAGLAGELSRGSDGNPLLLAEIVRFARDDPHAAATAPTIEQVLAARMARLADGARSLVEAIAVAGEPTALSTLAAAVDLTPEQCERAVGQLRVEHLARVAEHGRDPYLTAYHDMVRETIVAHLSPERQRDLHRRLAIALERTDGAPVDALARHWLAAGDRDHARAYLVRAARGAADKLAFSRAADLYRAALHLYPANGREYVDVLVAMADALELAGRYDEAAAAFARATEASAADAAADYTRRAADNLLRCGRVADGLAALERVAADLGVTIARTRRRALTALLWRRARIAARGYRYTRRNPADIAARDLGRLDTLYAVSTSLGMIDHIRGAAIQAQHLSTALRYGEASRVCRAFAIEAVFRASFGGRHAARAERLATRVELLAGELHDPYLAGLGHMARGAIAMFGARPQRAALAFREAEALFANQCSGAEWERITAAYFSAVHTILTGDIETGTRRAAAFVDAAKHRRNRYARALFATYPGTWAHLAADRPEAAHADLDAAIDGWPADTYLLIHHIATTARIHALLYAGDASAARQRLHATERAFRGAMLARLPLLAAERGVLWVQAGFGVGDRAAVHRGVRAVKRFGHTVGEGLVRAWRGIAAARDGRVDEARRALRAGIDRCDEAGYGIYALALRYRLAELIGGTEGARQRDAVRDRLARQGCAAPDRIVAIFGPAVRVP